MLIRKGVVVLINGEEYITGEKLRNGERRFYPVSFSGKEIDLSTDWLHNVKPVTKMCRRIANAIALLQEAGYAVATTAMDNEVLAELSGSEIEILSNHFQGKRTDSRLYLTLAHLEEDFEELPDGVKPIVKKILDSVPQKSGRPELVLIETE